MVTFLKAGDCLR